MMKKVMARILDSKRIIYSAYNDDTRVFCTVDVFDVEEDEKEVIIYGEGKDNIEISLNKYPDEVTEEDEGWQLKYKSGLVTLTIIK